MNTFEEYLIGWIAKEAEGKLTVYKPEQNKNVDLVVKKKARYGKTLLNLRVASTDKLGEGRIFIKDVLKKEFSPEKNFYLIFAYFDSVKRVINDYIWLIPSTEFNKLSEKIDKDTHEPKLRFEAPLNPEKKNKYSPFLIERKDLVDVLLDIAENPEKFKFSAALTLESKSINIDNLKEFIIEARENTYAGGGRETDNPRLLGSTQLEYQKANYFYRDVYFGRGAYFIGQEVVYQNNKPVWSMVYKGQETDKDTIAFLRKSLLKLSKECRLGGSCEFKQENHRYQDRGNGTLESFSGEEVISKGGGRVYSLNYMGGLLAK